MPPSNDAKSANRNLAARVCKSFATPEMEFTLDVECTAEPGFNVVFGPSGSGKTTLLDCIAGLAAPDQGRIAAGDRVLFDAALRIDIPTDQRNTGYVLQELALFPHLTVEQNTEYGLSHMPRQARRDRSTAILHEFRIDHLRSRRPAEISGGERQRVALARSLVTDPCVLLLDEPLSALDAPTKLKIIEDLRLWNEAHGIPILYVTHNRDEVFAVGERVLVLDKGKRIAQGRPHEVLSAPVQETVAQLAGFENIFDAEVDSVHADRGTLTCRLINEAGKSSVVLETPIIRSQIGDRLRVGIRAGDILLAVIKPEGLSAQNVIPGRLVSLERRDMIIFAKVDCGVEMWVQLTLAARDSLRLNASQQVWLVIKTHSCHLMRG
jgi:molybdate transport system ATP-binding protein